MYGAQWDHAQQWADSGLTQSPYFAEPPPEIQAPQAAETQM